MRKRNENIKTLQLFLLMALAAAGLILVFTNHELYLLIGSNPSVRALSFILWLTLGLSFIFILRDIRLNVSIKKDYRELDFALNNDRVSGIANRYSCDAIIEKYAGKPLPPKTGCIMLEIANLREINQTFGHTGGNRAISAFANILMTASVSLCFVGRNGGNKYIAIFEDCDENVLSSFQTRVNEKVARHNSQPDAVYLEYRSGIAYAANEPQLKTINSLIACADGRLTRHSDKVTGAYGRADCDDIINAYNGKPLPSDMGSLMFEIVNIREINDMGDRSEGNRAIRAFGDALNSAANGLGFVGRNGGNKFLVLIEECSEEHITDFISRLDSELSAYNNKSGVQPVRYAYGCAFHEAVEIDAVYKLVALSDRRLRALRV